MSDNDNTPSYIIYQHILTDILKFKGPCHGNTQNFISFTSIIVDHEEVQKLLWEGR